MFAKKDGFHRCRSVQNPYLTRTKPIYKIWVLKNPVLLPKPRFFFTGPTCFEVLEALGNYDVILLILM